MGSRQKADAGLCFKMKKESLRDNMSTTELVLNMLAETATKDISKVAKPDGFEENKMTVLPMHFQEGRRSEAGMRSEYIGEMSEILKATEQGGLLYGISAVY